MVMKLWESLKSKETSLDNLLKSLENKSKKYIEEQSLVYETWENKNENKLYIAMTRNSEIEKKSINFISNLMNDTIKNSKNPKIRTIYNKLEKLV